VLRMLLRAGANMAAKNKFGDIPLHLAEAAGNAPGYKMLHDAMAKRLAELRQRGAPAGGGAARAK
jgi:ankyrin repeat protein